MDTMTTNAIETATTPETETAAAPFDMTGVALVIRADYARLIAGFQPAQETRYYLMGFYAHPCPQGGAIVVATDSLIMGVMRDEFGYVGKSANGAGRGDIWRLATDTLKACRPAKKDLNARWLVILAADKGFRAVVVTGPAASPAGAEEAVSLVRAGSIDFTHHTALLRPIDGTFPDYQRVIPAEIPATSAPAFYPVNELAPFVAVALADNPRGHAFLSLRGADTKSPAYVLCGRGDFVGVIMPKAVSDTRALSAMSWLKPQAKASEAA